MPTVDSSRKAGRISPGGSMMAGMPMVFISHSSHDLESVREAEESLHAAGLDTFVAPRKIRPGQEWREEIREGVEQCDQVLVHWTANAARSEWVWIEIGMAIALNRSIVPFHIDRDVRLPDALHDLHAIKRQGELTEWAQNLVHAPTATSRPPYLRSSYFAERAWDSLYHFPGSTQRTWERGS